ncbi:molybdopterin biosynthesis protein [Tepidibacter formicigenes]|jgi:putative molybdopterin biosynthesis protein|uniref:Molybdopterin molybdenumtransferase n=1 Tax=Tepidibacter formicigenes DSM 15518 TaxID=1123349 RepID=A0A1M6QG09_9FIRM|nr:molybdopterin biosynthesis protein [Tepidibacter formicigenes]SHK19146.1 putative molybdopterin biosynthesis protein [Tepidibacter formicigenes DSM 15518]
MKKEDRNIYISNTDVDKAKEIFFSEIRDKFISYEEIDVLNSLNRVTSEAVFAKNSSPHYNSAAMDGIAVVAENTYGATEVNPKIIEEGKDFVYINTGNLIKEPYNAVIMIEDVIELEKGKVKILSPAHPWQHIRPIGEDLVANEMIIPSKHKIRPLDLGALIAGGVDKLKVYKKPKVGIIPTGSEIVEKFEDLKEGKIIDSNSRMFEGLVLEYGGIPNRISPVKDDYEILKNTILKAVDENDIVLINAGSSAGSEDYTVKIIREIGKVLVHGVAIKPGKPTILGIVNEKPVIGIPGYPVSSYMVFETLVKPLILKYSKFKENKEEIKKAVLSKRIVSSLKNKELVRVNLGYVKDKLIATPLTRGAGVTMSLVKADGVLEIPQNSEGIEAGNFVDVKLLKTEDSIKETLVSIGSHDLIMDIISDIMPLSSGHVGSMGGIMAMRRGECHISPIHLLDENTGEYNISYIKKYFKGRKMSLIKGVKRLQGFMIQKGNPKNINDFKDLIREDVSFVNRQRGAGTRILLDYNINKLDIETSDIKGYEREMTTHMAVAVSVKSNSCDTGLGIMSAAKAMDLDFIPVGYECYDFLVPFEYMEDEKIINFINVIKSEEFKNRINNLGGYEVENTGEVIIVGE